LKKTTKKRDMREQFLWGNHAGIWQLEAKNTLSLDHDGLNIGMYEYLSYRS
jgi:hypothetical protein